MATSAAQRVFDIAELKNLICIKHRGLMSPTAKIINDAIETLRKGGDLGFTEKRKYILYNILPWVQGKPRKDLLSVEYQIRLCDHFLGFRGGKAFCRGCHVECNIIDMHFWPKQMCDACELGHVYMEQQEEDFNHW